MYRRQRLWQKIFMKNLNTKLVMIIIRPCCSVRTHYIQNDKKKKSVWIIDSTAYSIPGLMGSHITFAKVAIAEIKLFRMCGDWIAKFVFEIRSESEQKIEFLTTNTLLQMRRIADPLYKNNFNIIQRSLRITTTTKIGKILWKCENVLINHNYMNTYIISNLGIHSCICNEGLVEK